MSSIQPEHGLIAGSIVAAFGWLVRRVAKHRDDEIAALHTQLAGKVDRFELDARLSALHSDSQATRNIVEGARGEMRDGIKRIHDRIDDLYKQRAGHA